MKRMMLMTMLAFVLTGTFAVAQEVEIPEDYGILPEFGTRVCDTDVAIHTLPIWSPDGTAIAIMGTSGDIWLAPAAGGEPALVYDNQEVTYQGYPVYRPSGDLCCFSPDGSEILFSQAAIDEARGAAPELQYADDVIIGATWSDYLNYLYATNVETGEIRTVAEGGWYGQYSPDGRYLAYAVNEFRIETGDAFLDEHTNQIIVRDLATSEETFLPLSANQPFFWAADSSAFLLHISPTEFSRVPIDGSEPELYQASISWLYCVDPPRPFLVAQESGVLYGVNHETGERTRITPDVPGKFTCPALSPEGTKLAYIVAYEGANPYDPYSTATRQFVFVMDMEATGLIPTAVTDAAPTAELVVGNYPNPFNPTTAIIFSLPGNGLARLDIYNLNGQKIRALVDGELNKGVHVVSWDGRDANGNPMATGSYIARILMDTKVATRRMMLMK